MKTARAKRPLMTRREFNLFAATGEELLLLAIRGGNRAEIQQELDLRALLCEGPRRARKHAAAPRLARAA